jgi:peroxiredoxin
MKPEDSLLTPSANGKLLAGWFFTRRTPYGVARKCLRWGAWVENQPHWFVIDRKGAITFILEPKFDTPTSYEKDVDLVLEALKKAAR